MRHQKLHLIRQDPAVAQYEVFPQAGHVRRVQQRHTSLLGCSTAFAVVAGTARGDDVHPGVNALLRKRHDVFAGQVFFMEVLAAIGAYIAVAHEKFAIGQAGFKLKRIDLGHALGANDAVDVDDGLVAGDGVVAAVKRCNARTHLPAHFFRGVVQHGFFQTDPRLRQPLG